MFLVVVVGGGFGISIGGGRKGRKQFELWSYFCLQRTERSPNEVLSVGRHRLLWGVTCVI